MPTLVSAQLGDALECYNIVDSGRDHQRNSGFEQWTDAYPTLDTILEDIAAGIAFKIVHEGQTIGYTALTFGDEPAYADPRAQWRSSLPYATIHRFAFGPAGRGRGLAAPTFEMICDYCLELGFDYIRVDTDFPNLAMQRGLERAGFVRCGIVNSGHGDRVAYDHFELAQAAC